MHDISGYRVLGLLQVTGNNLLQHAQREADRQHVIVKRPRSPHPGPRELERYRKEFRLLERLRGVPGVPRTLGLEAAQDRPVLVLEEVEGQPLSELLTGGPLEVGRCLELGCALASTLAEVHRRGVIHKDVKPSNVVVGPRGEVWLVDFGIATLQQVEQVEASPVHQVEGTLAYMSPEQTGRMNQSLDYRTDFYSLGVTLYEALTGRKPFQGRDALEWFHAHLAQAPEPPHQVVPSIPAMVSAVVSKLLAKGPAERYQSAEGLKADLEKCLADMRAGGLEAFRLGERDVPARFLLPTRLFGREGAVATLLEAFDRVARSGRPEVLLVSGYSGIGKSSVVNELHRPALQHKSFFLRGKFDQLQRDIPYATLAQAFRGLVQQWLAARDDELEGWRQRLLEAWEGNGQVLVDLVPQLELVAGKQPPVPELPPAESHNRFLRLFLRFLGVFSTRDRPLVLFLDDLQWADLASLKMIQHLASSPDTPPLLVVGAYRDNEVSASHPLVLRLDEMRKAGAHLTDVRLAALSPEQTRQLVAEALPGAQEDVLAPLAALVYEKTRGNPFFLLQLLQTLHRDGLVTRASSTGWQWDENGVRARGYSDNVVDLLVGRLRQLPAPTQQLLKLAACVGNGFSLQTLALISDQELAKVEKGLEDALTEGILTHAEEAHYRYLHDRVQQAAYSLIPEAERQAVHLRIGRLLLASLSPEEVKEKLFDVVSQLNAGAELMETPEEREKLARLNAEAGWKARASSAHRSAVSYFTTAFSLLPGDPWEADHALAFQLRLGQAHSEFMSGNAAEARQWVEATLPRARTRTEMQSLYQLKSNLLMASGDAKAAVACLLECLERFGLSIPLHPTREEVLAAHEEVVRLLGDRPIESLAELPQATDPDTNALVTLLSSLVIAYSFDFNLYVLHSCRMVEFSLRHGNTAAAALGYSQYGTILASFFREYRKADAFARMAYALMEKGGYALSRPKVSLYTGVLNLWSRHLSGSLELVRSAYHHALLLGDLLIAGYSSTQIVTIRFMLGHELAEVYQETVTRLDFSRKTRLDIVVHAVALPFQRYVQQLRGLSRSFETMSGEGFEEEAYEAGLAANPRATIQRFVFGVVKMQSRFMCGAYDEARKVAAQLQEVIAGIGGDLRLLLYHQYRALVLAACWGAASEQQRAEDLESIRQHHRQLAEWAEYCPENFRAPERMVFAELARVTGRTEEAHQAYEEAIRAAREHGFIQNVALASELASRFWKGKASDTASLAYARVARDAYRQWGAEGKVRRLEAQWPQLESAAPGEDTTTQGTTSRQIDALTVVKAQQAISGEIVLEKLARTLLQMALENAGAQRGALLLPRGETLTVVASSQDAGEVPWTVVAYVKRTKEAVLIGDAMQAHAYASDSYFQQSRARSVLCLPLLRQEKVHGVLYLENELAADAFTPGSQSLLGHIATQAAISMENARLYSEVRQAEAALRKANEELEERVEERTAQLKQAQARLVDTARAVGMAEVASNVLHNVGNVLTSVVVETQSMQQAVASSRTPRVAQVAALLSEHRDTLADFFTQDARGVRLPGYLSGLAGELAGEQEKLRQGLSTLEGHVSHIRAIVQVQQGYAKTTLMEEECDLRTLVEDALRIQLAAPPHDTVRVTREYQALSPVRVDKHKVLQILINLLSNARHALSGVEEAQRRLVLRLSQEGERVRLQVVDSGVGFSPDVRAKLFTHGFTTKPEGHGFGLHASFLAARQLGGSVLLESDGVGKGATATLEFPLSSA